MNVLLAHAGGMLGCCFPAIASQTFAGRAVLCQCASREACVGERQAEQANCARCLASQVGASGGGGRAYQGADLDGAEVMGTDTW